MCKLDLRRRWTRTTISLQSVRQPLLLPSEILIEEGKVELDTLIKDILPTYQSEDMIVQDLATVTNLLSHRTGLQRADPL